MYREGQRLLSSFEGPLVHDLTRSDEWTRRFGTATSPRAPWDTARIDGCLMGVASPGGESAGQPMRKSLRVWATFPLASMRAVCRDGDVSPLRGQREPLAGCRLKAEPLIASTSLLSDGARPSDRGALLAPLRSSEAYSGGHVEQGVKVESYGGMPDAPDSTARSAAEACARIADERQAAVEYWREKARAGDFGQVHSPASCYVRALDDPGAAAQPRQEPGYADAVMKEPGFEDRFGLGHLGEADFAAVKEVFGRKTEAFWIKGTIRTLVRGLVHDALTVGSPVRGHPIRLKGVQADFVADSLSKAAAEGLYRRGSSPWGSWAFSTEETSKRPARVVVDYRLMNRRLARAR